MLSSLKAKFILAFGALILVLFLGLGFTWITVKTEELSQDIAQSTLNFAELTAGKIVELKHLYLEAGDFLPFQRELSLLSRNQEAISNIQVGTFQGDLLFDADTEKQQRYTGAPRSFEAQWLDRLQSPWSSIQLTDQRVIFIKIDAQKNRTFIDVNENPIPAFTPTDRFQNIVIPKENAFAVVYTVNYNGMEARLNTAKLQIIGTASIGMLLALLIAIILSVSITNPLAALKFGAVRLAKGDFNTRVEVRSHDEVGVLAETFNTMAKDLSAAVETRIYSERVTKELEMAAKIQEDLLPKSNLELDSLEAAGDLHPATEIGGDAFDFIPTHTNETLIYLGDVSGHGVPAGILSSVANGLIYSMRDEADLKTLALRLNTVIQKKASNAMFMTMALTRWNPQTSELTFLNAGHLPLLHYSAKKQDVSELKLPGIAFGMIDDISAMVSTATVKLDPGDLIILYSDGFPEAQNEAHEQYGMDRFKEMVMQAGKDLLTAEAVKNTIFGDVMQFIGTREHLDDITIVVIRKK